MKTSALTGAQLDWAVSLITNPEWGFEHRMHEVTQLDSHYEPLFRPSREWKHGGPLVEREGIDISINYEDDAFGEVMYRVGWKASYWNNSIPGTSGFLVWAYGPTALIAAMRCFCCSKLGDVVDIPEELCQQQNS